MADRGGELEAHGVDVVYAGVVALSGVDLRLARAEILGLIGPNGAGKTSLVNVLSGFTPPTRGSVIVDGADATRWSPEHRARGGVVRTFQNIRLFEGLSVLENVAVGALGMGVGRRTAEAEAIELLALGGITGASLSRAAAGLPHGEARIVGILRALASRPRYLLLDEPAAGLNEAEGIALTTLLASIPASFGCAVMIIEHDMRVIMSLCQRIQVLDYGKTIHVGTPDEVQADPAVRAAYLGTPRAAAQPGVATDAAH